MYRVPREKDRISWVQRHRSERIAMVLNEVVPNIGLDASVVYAGSPICVWECAEQVRFIGELEAAIFPRCIIDGDEDSRRLRTGTAELSPIILILVGAESWYAWVL